MPRRFRLRSKLGLLIVSTATIVLAVTVAALATTSFESYDRSGPRPAWAAVCLDYEPRPDRQLLADCARGTGLVGWVRERKTGPSREVHFALVGRFGVLIVKLGEPDLIPTPSVGSHVTAVGALVRASNGMREIQAWRLLE